MGANVLAHAWKSRTQSRVEFSKWAWIEVVGGTIVVAVRDVAMLLGSRLGEKE